MEFYNAVSGRRTCREFTEEPVDRKALQRILQAAVKAPTNNHLRRWQFVLCETEEEKENALQQVKLFADAHQNMPVWPGDTDCAKSMYAYAVPRQYSMLKNAPVLLIPFYQYPKMLFEPAGVNSFNTLAAAWCMVENIFLAASAEGLSCSIRIPVGQEAFQTAKALQVPEGWIMPCYIGIGHAANAALPFSQPDYNLEENLHAGSFGKPFHF